MELAATQHQETRSQIFTILNAATRSLDNQFRNMRTEIERVNNELAQNRLEQSRTEQRVEIIAKAMSTAKTDKQRKK